jgi:hypothetical protein
VQFNIFSGSEQMPLTREIRIFSVIKVFHSEYCGVLSNYELLRLEANGPEPRGEKVLHTVLPLVNIKLFR